MSWELPSFLEDHLSQVPMGTNSAVAPTVPLGKENAVVLSLAPTEHHL